ncbi:MAG TPA: hypothetical protein VJT80_13470 [Steroidobacteraceae bacterium]|nr:hypothetical protein [Steroidobacteraceae bacterium]
MSKNARKRVVRPENWAALEYFGEALKHWASTGDTSKLLRSVMSVDNIADCLIQIARGEDAREVFRQAGHTGRGRLGWYHSSLALTYWHHRVSTPHSHAKAIEATIEYATRLKDRYNVAVPSRESIARYARKHQDISLWYIENNDSEKRDLAGLRALLAKKSKGTPRGHRTRK